MPRTWVRKEVPKGGREGEREREGCVEGGEVERESERARERECERAREQEIEEGGVGGGARGREGGERERWREVQAGRWMEGDRKHDDDTDEGYGLLRRVGERWEYGGERERRREIWNMCVPLPAVSNGVSSLTPLVYAALRY